MSEIDKAIEHYLEEEAKEEKSDLIVRKCRTCGEMKRIWSHERCKECYFTIRKWENEHRREVMRMDYHTYKTKYSHCRTALGSYRNGFIAVFIDDYTFYRSRGMTDMEAQAFINFKQKEEDLQRYQVLKFEIKKAVLEELKKEKENEVQ